MNEEMKIAVNKFHRALDVLQIKHDEETGRLSEPLVMIAYEARRKIIIERVLILKNFFLIINDQDNDVRKIYYDKVQGFRSSTQMFD